MQSAPGRNNTIHGLTGKSPILPGEDPDLLDLAAQYCADLHPEGHVEQDLVERMAIATYRLRRIARIEAGYLDYRARVSPVPERHNRGGNTDPLAWVFHLDCTQGNILDRLNRYESRIQRDYSRCLSDLQSCKPRAKKEIVQTNRKSKVTPVHPTPSSDSTSPVHAATQALPAPDRSTILICVHLRSSAARYAFPLAPPESKTMLAADERR